MQGGVYYGQATLKYRSYRPCVCQKMMPILLFFSNKYLLFSRYFICSQTYLPFLSSMLSPLFL